MTNLDNPFTPNYKRRNNLLKLLGVTVVTVGALSSAYWYFMMSTVVSTDNAYTAVESAQITPSVNGTVHEILVKDTSVVKKGDLLVVLDPTDANLALIQAEAELARAVQRVKSFVANDTGLNAVINAKKAGQDSANAQLRAARSDVDRALLDVQRRARLISSGAVSGEDLSKFKHIYNTALANLDIARAAADQANAAIISAESSQQANAIMIASPREAKNPEIMQATARRDQAATDLKRTKIYAPVDGIVAKRQVQLGQRVTTGMPLLSIVPVEDMHVMANFKERQLQNVKPGQHVTLQADIYGNKVVYNGVVEGLAAGSGAAFAAIPAQNATGNWIKVVQRLPVRIKLNASELKQNPLKVGLSMTATIDTSN